MTTKTAYLNSPVKNCQTCVHSAWTTIKEDGKLFEKRYCLRFQNTTVNAYPNDCRLDEWKAIPPKPPRRSLRAWLYDLLWRRDL